MNLLIVLDCCEQLLLCVLLYICVLANVARWCQAKSHLAQSCKMFYETVKDCIWTPSQFFILNIRFICTQRLVMFSAFIF